MWRLSLYALHLTTGREISDRLKHTTGVFFGFCNSDGIMQPMKAETATHVGWTVDEAVAT